MNDTSMMPPSHKKIYDWFRVHNKECYAPKEVAVALGLKYNTVKDSVIKMANAGYLRRICRGVYCFGGGLTPGMVEGKLSTETRQFHGCQFVIKGEVPPGTVNRNIFFETGLASDLRSIIITDYETTTVVSVRCTDNPLTDIEMVSLMSWIRGAFRGTEINLVNVGLNRDLPCSLQGCAVTIEEFQNSLLRIYQKGTRTRIEHHVSGSISIEQLLRIENEFYRSALMQRVGT